MKKFSIFLLSIFSFSLLTLPVWAVSPTPEVSPSRVEEIREAVKEKVREKLNEVKKGQKRAFVGEITEITNSTLALKNEKGERQAKITDDATIIGKGKQKIEFEDLEIGNFVIAMGYLDENNILQTQRLVVTNKPEVPVREAAFGKVTNISSTETEKIITVKNEKKDMIYTVEITSKTKITKKIEGKMEQVEFKDIEIDDKLVAVGTPEKNEEKIIIAKIIHIIPGLTKSQTPTPEATSTPEE